MSVCRAGDEGSVRTTGNEAMRHWDGSTSHDCARQISPWALQLSPEALFLGRWFNF